MRAKKTYSITHPVMFAVVMKNPELCRGLIERIFPGRRVKDLHFVYSADEDENNQEVLRTWEQVNPETEKTVIVGIEAKSIRMDVLFENDAAWYDIELQIVNRDHLPKRSRYYHAVKAVDSLKTGQPYGDLKPGYVIFITTFDLFAQNQALHYFQMKDENGLPLGDGQYTIFLNGACEEGVPEELESFYRYLRTGVVTVGDDWLRQMDAEVQKVNCREEVRGKVTLYDEMLQMQTIVDRLKEAAERKEAQLEESQAQLEESQAQLEERQAQLEESQAQLEESQAQLEESQAQLEESQKLQELNVLLAKQGRMEDLIAAASDVEFRKKLFAEFGL